MHFQALPFIYLSSYIYILFFCLFNCTPGDKEEEERTGGKSKVIEKDPIKFWFTTHHSVHLCLPHAWFPPLSVDGLGQTAGGGWGREKASAGHWINKSVPLLRRPHQRNNNQGSNHHHFFCRRRSKYCFSMPLAVTGAVAPTRLT